MSSVSNGLYFLTLPLVSVMRVIYQKIRHTRYLYIKRNVEKVWGARYLSKNMVIVLGQNTKVDPKRKSSFTIVSKQVLFKKFLFTSPLKPFLGSRHCESVMINQAHLV